MENRLTLRVIAFAILILYHVGMFFVPWTYHLKNDVIYPDIRFPMLFVNQWRLPLLFVISGMGTWYGFRKRTAGQFAVERLRRLFVPFVFGCLFIIPPQIYIERLTQGVAFDGYFDFWPASIVSGVYPAGNFSWHNLWFVLYLLLFSWLLAPVFGWLKRHPECGLLRMVGRLTGRLGGLYALALPLLVLQLTLADRFPVTNALVGDWFNLLHSCTLFFTGFVLLSAGEGFWTAVTRGRWIYLAGGVAAFALILLCAGVWGDFPHKALLTGSLRTFNMWSWILAIFGFGAVCLTRPSRALTYANEAVYPFFVLHQTVLFLIAWPLVGAGMAFWPKFLIMGAGTFGGCWVIYEFGIRRWRPMRFLFGMK